MDFDCDCNCKIPVTYDSKQARPGPLSNTPVLVMGTRPGRLALIVTIQMIGTTATGSWYLGGPPGRGVEYKGPTPKGGSSLNYAPYVFSRQEYGPLIDGEIWCLNTITAFGQIALFAFEVYPNCGV